MAARSVRRRLLLAPALVALALPLIGAAPQPQQESPPAVDALVEGVVVHQEGSPAGGVPVTVDGSDGPGFAGILAAVFTLGLACLDLELCAGTSVDGAGATTGADGAYQGTLPGSYVAGTETDTDWVVTAQLPPSAGQVRGPSSSFEFEVNIAVQSAPPLPLWEQPPSVSADGWQVTASMDDGPPSGTGSASVSIGNPGGGRVTTTGRTATIDARRIESTDDADVSDRQMLAYATARADVRVPHANGRTIYHQLLYSPTVKLAPLHLVPPSRGATCSYAYVEGATPIAGDRECPLTDGNRSFTIDDGLASATIDLRSGFEVADVFVAGCMDYCLVEVSADGTEWSPLPTSATYADPDGTRSAQIIVASPDAPVPARFVRISREGGLDDIREVSVWPATPEGAAAATAATSTTVATTIPPIESDSDSGYRPIERADGAGGRGGGKGPLAATALVALGLVMVGLAVAWARRRI